MHYTSENSLKYLRSMYIQRCEKCCQFVYHYPFDVVICTPHSSYVHVIRYCITTSFWKSRAPKEHSLKKEQLSSAITHSRLVPGIPAHMSTESQLTEKKQSPHSLLLQPHCVLLNTSQAHRIVGHLTR